MDYFQSLCVHVGGGSDEKECPAAIVYCAYRAINGTLMLTW